MGLDQRLGYRDPEEGEVVVYEWRKHYWLHRFFESEWIASGNEGVFNCVRLYLTEDIVDRLDRLVRPGDDSPTHLLRREDDDHYYDLQDRDAVALAKKCLRKGWPVWYSSDW